MGTVGNTSRFATIALLFLLVLSGASAYTVEKAWLEWQGTGAGYEINTIAPGLALSNTVLRVRLSPDFTDCSAKYRNDACQLTVNAPFMAAPQTFNVRGCANESGGIICTTGQFTFSTKNSTNDVGYLITLPGVRQEGKTSLAVVLDNTTPSVQSIRTGFCEGEVCYAAANVPTPITITFKDTITSFNYKLVALGRDAAQNSRWQVQNCTGNTCTGTLIVQCTDGERLQLQLRPLAAGIESREDAMNPIEAGEGQTVVCSTKGPQILEWSRPEADGIAGQIVSNGSVIFRAKVRSDIPIQAMVNTSNATAVSTVAGVCNSETSDETLYACTWTLAPLRYSAPTNGKVNLQFRITNHLGGYIDKSVPINVLNLSSRRINQTQEFFTINVGKVTPERINRMTLDLARANFQPYPSYVTYTFSRKNAKASILKQELRTCWYKLPNETNYTTNLGLFSFGGKPVESRVLNPEMDYDQPNRLNLQIRADRTVLARSDKFNVKCQLDLYVAEGVNIYASPQSTNITFTIQLRESALGQPGEAFVTKIQEEEAKLNSDSAKFVRNAEKVMSTLDNVCRGAETLYMVQTIGGALQTTGAAMCGGPLQPIGEGLARKGDALSKSVEPAIFYLWEQPRIPGLPKNNRVLNFVAPNNALIGGGGPLKMMCRQVNCRVYAEMSQAKDDKGRTLKDDKGRVVFNYGQTMGDATPNWKITGANQQDYDRYVNTRVEQENLRNAEKLKPGATPTGKVIDEEQNVVGMANTIKLPTSRSDIYETTVTTSQAQTRVGAGAPPNLITASRAVYRDGITDNIAAFLAAQRAPATASRTPKELFSGAPKSGLTGPINLREATADYLRTGGSASTATPSKTSTTPKANPGTYTTLPLTADGKLDATAIMPYKDRSVTVEGAWIPVALVSAPSAEQTAAMAVLDTYTSTTHANILVSSQLASLQQAVDSAYLGDDYYGEEGEGTRSRAIGPAEQPSQVSKGDAIRGKISQSIMANANMADPSTITGAAQMMCFGGVIYGLQKKQAIDCGYLMCLKEQSLTGNSVATCELSKGYSTCMFAMGEAGELPFVRTFKNIMQNINQIIQNLPSFAVNMATDITCDIHLKRVGTGCTDWVQIGCRVRKSFLGVQDVARETTQAFAGISHTEREHYREMCSMALGTTPTQRTMYRDPELERLAGQAVPSQYAAAGTALLSMAAYQRDLDAQRMSNFNPRPIDALDHAYAQATKEQADSFRISDKGVEGCKNGKCAAIPVDADTLKAVNKDRGLYESKEYLAFARSGNEPLVQRYTATGEIDVAQTLRQVADYQEAIADRNTIYQALGGKEGGKMLRSAVEDLSCEERKKPGESCTFNPANNSLFITTLPGGTKVAHITKPCVNCDCKQNTCVDADGKTITDPNYQGAKYIVIAQVDEDDAAKHYGMDFTASSRARAEATGLVTDYVAKLLYQRGYLKVLTLSGMGINFRALDYNAWKEGVCSDLADIQDNDEGVIIDPGRGGKLTKPVASFGSEIRLIDNETGKAYSYMTAVYANNPDREGAKGNYNYTMEVVLTGLKTCLKGTCPAEISLTNGATYPLTEGVSFGNGNAPKTRIDYFPGEYNKICLRFDHNFPDPNSGMVGGAGGTSQKEYCRTIRENTFNTGSPAPPATITTSSSGPAAPGVAPAANPAEGWK